MNSVLNRWIFLGSLSTVFIITLIFGYSPGYGHNLLSAIGISAKIKNNKEMSPQVSPSVMVTDNSVTNISLVSPQMSPLISSNIKQSQIINSMSPMPGDMVTDKVTPTHYQNQNMSPTPNVTPTSITPTPTAPIQTPTTATNVGSVVINEIAWMGTSFSANDEWIELFNVTNVPISLEGWTLSSLTGSSPDPKITLSGSIPAQGYIILERTDDTTISDIQAFKIYTGALNDTGEALELRDNNGNMVDSIPKADKGWFAGDKNSRASMERINPHISGSQASNWATNNSAKTNGHDGGIPSNTIKGTPSNTNSVASF